MHYAPLRGTESAPAPYLCSMDVEDDRDRNHGSSEKTEKGRGPGNAQVMIPSRLISRILVFCQSDTHMAVANIGKPAPSALRTRVLAATALFAFIL